MRPEILNRLPVLGNYKNPPRLGIIKQRKPQADPGRKDLTKTERYKDQNVAESVKSAHLLRSLAR